MGKQKTRVSKICEITWEEVIDNLESYLQEDIGVSEFLKTFLHHQWDVTGCPKFSETQKRVVRRIQIGLYIYFSVEDRTTDISMRDAIKEILNDEGINVCYL